MPLPDSILTFWYAMESLALTCERTPWGVVISDARYPTIYDANHAGILESAHGLELEEVRAALHPILRRAGATHEHIEVMDVSDPCPAVDALLAEQQRITSDVVMRFDGSGIEPVSDAAVEEVWVSDERFRTAYRDSRNEFGEELSDEVVDQLVTRDWEVFVPAGLRFFAGIIDGEIAGFTSLIPSGDTAYVDNVVTLPAYRRRGVASATVTRALEEAEKQGLTTVFLLAEENGDPQRLYERLGFSVISRAMGFTRPLPPG